MGFSNKFEPAFVIRAFFTLRQDDTGICIRGFCDRVQTQMNRQMDINLGDDIAKFGVFDPEGEKMIQTGLEHFFINKILPHFQSES